MPEDAIKEKLNRAIFAF